MEETEQRDAKTKTKEPDHVEVSYEYVTHDTRRGQIWAFTGALRTLGVDDPDG